MPEVLKTYAILPNELRYEYACAQYIVKMFAKNGDMERAEEYLGLLSDRYGESEGLKRLRVETAKIESTKLVLERPADIIYSDYSIEALQNALLRISKLQDPECAKLRIEATHEAHLLYMVLDVARLMEQYSGLLKYEGEIAGENTYNKLFQILFNQKNQEIYDFYAMDQTQEGTATGTLKNGRESVGSLDNAIYHGSRIVSIMEGLILRRCEKASIELHTRKIEGYNPMHVSTVFILIYADTAEVTMTRDIIPNYVPALFLFGVMSVLAALLFRAIFQRNRCIAYILIGVLFLWIYIWNSITVIGCVDSAYATKYAVFYLYH